MVPSLDWFIYAFVRKEGRALLADRAPRCSRVLVETTGKERDRFFVYRAYLDLLRVGTELERVAKLGILTRSMIEDLGHRNLERLRRA